MGYDLNRFTDHVDEELVCPICGGVLEDAVQADTCEHAFCRRCIERWLSTNTTCPVDRELLVRQQLVPVPRITRNMLNRMLIRCENSDHGCDSIVRLEHLPAHIRDCEVNPTRPVQCLRGCGVEFPMNEQDTHNCVASLRSLVDEQSVVIRDFERRLVEQQAQIQSVNHIVNRLQAGELVSAARVSRFDDLVAGPSTTSPSDEHRSSTTDDLQIWAESLPRAKVTRWGGMISTPDAVLQTAIRRSLIDCGCPFPFAEGLMERAHERAWPSGLQSLEVRQHNRTAYQRYVCRKIPGRQGVLLLAIDNRHMPDDMICEPGVVMIFATGVE